MISSILLGLLRHALTAAGGMLVSRGVQFVEGLPVIHDLITVASGAAMVAAGTALSALQKVKTKSDADFKNLNQ